MTYHPLAWLSWLAATAYLVLVNQQPLHATLTILAAGIVFSWGMRKNPLTQGWQSFMRLGAWVWAMAVLFNVLFSHNGVLTIIRLPARWPLLGGPLTWESLLYGAANGATLFATLLVFAAFNLVIDRNRLLRWIPSGLYQSGLVVSIALAFVPQMMSSLQSIREAQTIRGHRLRGIRDLVPLLVPLVTTALERSLVLAESMESRGFGGTIAHSEPRQGGWAIVSALGLLAVLFGLLVRGLWPSLATPGQVVAWLGGCLLSWAILHQGRRVRRSVYRSDVWQTQDSRLLMVSALQMGLVWFAQKTQPMSLVYNPYPPFSPWPTFSATVGLAACLVAAPVLLAHPGPRQPRAGGPWAEPRSE